jgi:hypothetical protein
MLHGFFVPATRRELEQLDDDVILVFAGSGSVTTSASFSLSMPVTALANVSIPGGQNLTVKPGLSLSVAPSLTLEGGYQVRLRKLDKGEVEVGLYNSTSKTKSLSISGRAALPVRAGSFELTEQFIRALSVGQSVVNREELFAALPDEADEFKKHRRIEKMEEQFRKAVNTKFEASARISLSKSSLREPVWTYAVNPAVVSQASDKAIAAALKGNFAELLANPPGVRRVSSALAETESRSAKLDINLLGLANFTSSTRLVVSVQHRVRRQRSDHSHHRHFVGHPHRGFAGESRRRQQPTPPPDERKLSDPGRLQSQRTHHFSAQAQGSAHLFRNRQQDQPRRNARQSAGPPGARLVMPEKVAEILETDQNFGRTTMYVEAAYDNAAIESLFFDGGSARSQDKFEDAGRSALGALIAGDEHRQLSSRFAGFSVAANALWERMKVAGAANLHDLFGIGAASASGNLPLATATSDFFAILDWAKTMHAAAQVALDVRNMLGGDQKVESTDPRFEAARKLLRQRLSDAVARTGEHFGDPLGLLMGPRRIR